MKFLNAPKFARPLHLLWSFALLLSISVGELGCKSDDANAYPTQPITEAGHTAEQTRAAAVGNACASVKDCPSYLWCVEKVCKMPTATQGKHDESTPSVSFFDAQGAARATFYLELARTPDEHEKGLMFRRSLPDDWGMLFIYPDEGKRSFWMENTFISLDMLFINARGKVVHVLENAVPLTRTPRDSEEFARYVLEIRGGRAAELGLRAGQHVKLANLDAASNLQP